MSRPKPNTMTQIYEDDRKKDKFAFGVHREISTEVIRSRTLAEALKAQRVYRKAGFKVVR